MKQRWFNFAAALSLMLAAALLVVWCRGLFTRDRIAVGFGRHFYAISTFPHHLYIDRDPGWRGMQASAQFGLAQYPLTAKYWEPRLIDRSQGAWSLAIPFWLPLMFASALPAWWAMLFSQGRRRNSRGLCSSCGYDLRGSSGRCPECGTDPVRLTNLSHGDIHSTDS